MRSHRTLIALLILLSLALTACVAPAAPAQPAGEAAAPDATVADILALLVADLPVLVPEILGDDGNLRSNIAIFRNGRNIRLLDNLETRVSSDQTLDLFPKIGAYRVFGS